MTLEKSEKISKTIRALPDSPGVYKFLDRAGTIIYVGKARRLKRRVSTYFQRGRAKDARLQMLVGEVARIEHIRTSSEAEALIYEAGLIKDYSPKYNIELKDDKSYPYLKLTMNEKYPRLFLTRRRKNDGGVYYGPYVNVMLLKEAVTFMKKVFPLRTCRRFHKTVCLEYHIEQCPGPCEGKVSHPEYMCMVKNLKKFLEGRKGDLVNNLQKEMKLCSDKHKYEKALAVKKRIEALTAIQQMHDTSQHPIFGELDELQNALQLKELPITIECFDISNISGSQAVGSMVKFVGGKPKKNEYRKFRIKSVRGVDDCSMIKEVVKRRYSRILKEEKSFPDLILIDGGRGQLSSAQKELTCLGINNIPLASIAKERNHLYSSTRKHPIRLSPGSRLLLLIQRIRDEAHRFAITYHRKLRSAETFKPGLKLIPGVGPVKEKLLMEKFGNIGAIRTATREMLLSSGIDKRTARAIVRYFRRL